MAQNYFIEAIVFVIVFLTCDQLLNINIPLSLIISLICGVFAIPIKKFIEDKLK